MANIFTKYVTDYVAPRITSVFNKKKKTESQTQQGSWGAPTTPQQTKTNTPSKAVTDLYKWSLDKQKEKQEQITPTTEPKAQTNQPSYVSGIEDLANRADRRYQDRITFEKKATDIGQQQADERFNVAQKRLDEQIPELEKQSQATQELILKGKQSGIEQAERAKANISDQSGETMRNQAQSRREVDARRNQIFAGNNTSESYGVGGYQLEQANADTEFLREQAKTQRDRDNQLADIDSQVVDLEVKAQSAINSEVAKFNDMIRQIQNAKYDNEITRRQDMENAYIGLEEKLMGISDSYEQNRSALDEMKFNLDLQYQESQAPDSEGESKLRQEYLMRTEKSGFPEVYSSYNKILNSQDTAAGDVSMIFAYMKMLDPGSVVREGEFANAQNTAGIPDRVRAAYNNAINGERLAPTQRQSFKSEATNIFNNARKQQDLIDSYYSDQATQGKYDPYNVTGLYGSYQNQQPSGGQNGNNNSDPLGLFSR